MPMNILHIRILDMLQTEQKFNKSAPDDRKKTCYLSVFSEKLPAKTDEISYKVVGLLVGLVLWHVNHCRLFNAKSIVIHKQFY